MRGLPELRTLVWIEQRLIEELCGEAERTAPLEIGGVLMGYWADRRAVVVTDVIGPGPDATHEEGAFAPDYDYHESRIAGIYQASGGVVTYLGDWHSHPGGGTNLSRKDRRLLREIARHEESRAPRPLMAILGGGPDWQLALWVVLRVGSFGLVRPCRTRVYEAEISSG